MYYYVLLCIIMYFFLIFATKYCLNKWVSIMTYILLNDFFLFYIVDFLSCTVYVYTRQVAPSKKHINYGQMFWIVPESIPAPAQYRS
jgi:hypothetical protein